MKAILLSRSDKAKIAKALFAIRGGGYVTSEVWHLASAAVDLLDLGSKDVNPFDVFNQYEKELIIEALECAAAAYRQDGDPGKVERAHKFEAIAQQARTGPHPKTG